MKDTDLWRTPDTPEQPIVNLVQSSFELGQIGLDPVADAGKLIPATAHYTRDDNCLLQSWDCTSLYMNPPFSTPAPFVTKLAIEYNSGVFSEAIALLKSGCVHNKGTGSVIAKSAGAICFWGAGKSSRIAFLNGDGVPVKGADFDCVLVYWGRQPWRFKQAFSDYGLVLPNRSQHKPNKGEK